MSRYSIDEFVRETKQKDHGEGLFELENPRLLEINLQEHVWTKSGSMIAYRGDIRFSREGVFEHGIGTMLKRAVSGEGTKLTKASGTGQLYVADSGKKISILHMEGGSIFVNGNDILAFEDSINWDIKLMKKLSAMFAGGLFNVKLEGDGMVAITTHYEPITLLVTPESPVYTDPSATVAWSGSLTPEFKTDISLKTLIGRSSGESFQMKFEGEGFVVVQPYEELDFQSPGE